LNKQITFIRISADRLQDKSFTGPLCKGSQVFGKAGVSAKKMIYWRFVDTLRDSYESIFPD
jgi:hypothetical protein